MKKFQFKSSWMNLKNVTKAFFFLFHNSNTLIFTHSEPPFIKTLHTFNSLKALRWLKESSVTEKCHFSSFENVWSKLVPVSKTIALQVGRFLTLVVFFVLAGGATRLERQCHFPWSTQVCWSIMLSNIFIYFLSHLTDTVSSLFLLFRAGISDFTCRNQVSSRTQGLWLQPFLHLSMYTKGCSCLRVLSTLKDICLSSQATHWRKLALFFLDQSQLWYRPTSFLCHCCH